MPNKTLNCMLLSHTPDPLETIALAGRLCYSDSQIGELYDKSKGSAESFAKKLLSLGHLSPIEHASFTFGVEGVSRALLAQITRHRIASFSVQSQRYVQNVEMNYIIPKTVEALGEEAITKFKEQMDTAHEWYKAWLDMGIPAEDARFVLPNAAETRMVFTMNARELLHFFSLRCCNRAQWEIRALAWAMLGMARREAFALFENAGPSCVLTACSEGKMSCGEAEEMRSLNEMLSALAMNKASDDEILRFVTENL